MTRIFALVILGGIAAFVGAADWPQFRGPNRDNVSSEKGLLTSWPKDGPTLLWTSDDVGHGFSSISAVGDRIYTMGNKGDAAMIYALDRKSGKEVWKAKVGGNGTQKYPGTRGTPTVHDGLVYAIGPEGDLVCVTADKGEEKWRKSFTEDYKGRRPNWDFAESPLVDGDRLVCTPGGSVASMVALDRKTGKELWKATTGDPAGYASIVISNAGGVKQYVTLTSNGTIGVDAESGKRLWIYDKFSRNTANIPTPIVLGEQIFTEAGYGKGAALLTLSKNGGGIDMKAEWHDNQLTNKHGGLVIVGDYVYGDAADRGNVACAEWKTGKVKWQRSPGGGGKGKKGGGGPGGSGSASITYADGHLYVRFSDGTMALVPATPDGYKAVSTFKIPTSNTNSWAHPVVVDGRLYLREKGNVYCYDVKAK